MSDLVALNRTFIRHVPPIGESRSDMLAAEQARADRAERGEPMVTLRQNVVEQDDLSGLISSGYREVMVYDDGREEVGEVVVPHPATEADRLAMVQARVGNEVAATISARLAAGLQIAGIGTVDVSQSALMALGARAQLASIAIQREAEFDTVLDLLNGGTVTLDAEQTIDAYYQASTYVAAVEAHARDLNRKAAVAETAEDANTISLTAGWPPAQPRVDGKFVKSVDLSPDA